MCSLPPVEFPPLATLGYGLNLTKLQPFDPRSVAKAQTDVRVVDVTKDTSTRIVTIDGVDYQVPRVVTVSTNVGSQRVEKIYPDGTFAVQDLKNDASVAFRLLPITTSNISFFPLDKSLPRNDQFYFLATSFDTYSAALREYLDFINEDELLKYVSPLSPFDPNDPDVVQSYVEFFNTVGSHFVANTNYGAHFELEVWASNKYSDVNSNFKRDVTASIKGLNDGGEYDDTVFSEPQYGLFDRLSQRIVRVQGGTPSFAEALIDKPDNTTFQEWVGSISSNPVLVSIRALEIWTLLLDANNGTLRNRARDIQAAFEYITSLPGPENNRYTWVSFEMDASWAEFGILNPSVVIAGGDSEDVPPTDSLVIGPAKLRFGSPKLPRQQQFTALVGVINDGTPINVYVSSISGWAKVTILGLEYKTEGGTQWFYDVPLSV